MKPTHIALSDMLDHKTMRCTPINVAHPFDSDAEGIAFTLDNTTYLVFEDPSDGYRSQMGTLLGFAGDLHELGHSAPTHFVNEPIEPRAIQRREHSDISDGYWTECDVIQFLNPDTGEVIFEFGTDNSDDYYPSWHWAWNPGRLSVNTQQRTN